MVDDSLLKPELAFSQDGDDLVVTADVGANNSPHVLWTRVSVNRAKVIPIGGSVAEAKEVHRVSLHYYIFQNRDLYHRSTKSVHVAWRLPGHTKGDETYKVFQTFDPDSVELMDLVPKLQALANGERF